MNTLKDRIVTHPFFREMFPGHLAIIESGAKDAEFPSGELLCREGEPANRFYLIETGRVAIETRVGGSVRILGHLGPGDVLGWSWLFPPFGWHFQARTEAATRVIVLNGAHLLISAEKDHDFGYDLMKRVSQVVIQRLQSTRKQLVEH
jgi:CRP/FNR family cyclic AMP-dependent transcriptional regulator